MHSSVKFAQSPTLTRACFVSHRLLWFAYYLDIHRRTACSGGMFSPCPAVPVSVPLSCGRVHNTRAPAEASNDCQRTLAFLPSLDLTVHPVSKTHWAIRRRQPSLLTASCCATSQVMPMLFKSCCMVSIQFFRGLPGFLFVPLTVQCTTCFGSLLSSIRRTCPSHLSLLSFMMRSIFSSCVCALTLSLLTLSFHGILQ